MTNPSTPDVPRQKWSIAYFAGRLLLIVFAVFFVVAFVLPLTSRKAIRGPQTKALAQSKGIGLALKLYADDHDGVYPAGTNVHGQPIRSANDAFRSLIPAYTRSEVIFGNPLSAYQTSQPDNVIEPIAEALKPGENVYAYISGVNRDTPEEKPLLADGGDGSGRGLYVSDPQARGGVWRGTKAVVIYVDNHGVVETLTGPANARFVAHKGDDGQISNPLSLESLGPDLKMLEPAQATRAR